MDYTRLLTRAAQITWRYKFLWIFGFLMALCGQGGGGRANFQVNYRTPTPFDSTSGPFEFPAFFPEPLGQTPVAVYLVAGLLFITIFALFSLIVGALGRSALIKTVANIEADQPVSLATSWQDGLAKARPLGLLQAILYSPLFIVAVVGLIVFLTQLLPFFDKLFQSMPNLEEEGALPPLLQDFFAFFPLFFGAICGLVCITFIVQLVGGLFLTFGSRAIVLENAGIFGSFPRSWLLFRQNLGATLLLAVLVAIIGAIINVAAAIPVAVIAFPVMFSAVPDIFSESGPSLPTYFLLGSVALFSMIVFSIVGGVLRVFIEAVWTLAYQEFVSRAN